MTTYIERHIERQKALFKCALEYEREDFEIFLNKTPSCSKMTYDEKFTLFLYTRETTRFFELEQKKAETFRKRRDRFEEQQGIILDDFKTNDKEISLLKLSKLNKEINSRRPQWSASEEMYELEKLLQDEIITSHKRSVESSPECQSVNVFDVSIGESSSQIIENILLGDDVQELVCERDSNELKRDVLGASKNSKSLSEEQLPDEDVVQFKVCHNSQLVIEFCSIKILLVFRNQMVSLLYRATST